jgi:hypothetical protein
MKRNILFIIISFMVFAVFVSVLPARENMPPPEARAFWTYITETNPYTQWSFWPGKEGMYPGTSPHGAFLKLYANDIAIEAAKAGQPMPDGAIIVKENYGPDKQELMAITPMYKMQGYNPDAGDWFWAKYGPDGSVDTAGKVDSCINCHTTADDFRFTRAK